ncbi:MAG: hypothetical protein WC758_00650 [Candidatus Woesearchaeota archaeon]|jgi:hypothetical protein
MDYVNQMQKSGAFSTTLNPNNPRPFTPTSSQVQSPLTKTGDDESKSKIAEFQDALAMQKNKFDRTISILQNRIDSLEKEVAGMRLEFEKIAEKYNKFKDKETVEQSREALFNRQDRPPVDKPIDRNHVAPSDVQISNIFNMSGKKF